MNYSLYLLSESFRSPGQYISLPVDWAVCNTLAVQLLSKGKVNARLPPGPTTGACWRTPWSACLQLQNSVLSRHPTFWEPQFHSTECLQRLKATLMLSLQSVEGNGCVGWCWGDVHLSPWTAAGCQAAPGDGVPDLYVVTTGWDVLSWNDYCSTCYEPNSPLKHRGTYDGFSPLRRG